MPKNNTILKLVLFAAGLVVIIIAPLVIKNRFMQNTMILIFMYAVLAQAWNIMGGYTGLISVGQAAFFGVGAYVSSFLLSKYGVNPWLGMLAGGLLTGAFGVLVGLPFCRLRGRYFAIAMMALGEVMRILFSNWEFVGAARGIQQPIKPESLLNFQFHTTKIPYYYIIAALFLLVTGLVYWLERSRTGFYFRAIRENDEVAAAMGIDRTKYKLIAIGLSAAFTAMAGSFLAQYSLYVEPEYVFAEAISVTIAMVAVFGGIGNVAGPLLGALVLVPLSEYTRGALGGAGRGIDLLIYGALIVLFCVYEPSGMMGLWRRVRSRAR